MAFFLFFPLLSSAQIRIDGKIIDAKTKAVVPFANVENFRTKIGAQANQDGRFSLNIPNGKQTDTLKISCIGYVDQLVTNLKSVDDISYELTPIVFQLSTVTIGKSKTREIEVGILNKSGHKWESMNQRLQNPGMQNAVFMQNAGLESAYIEKLHFFMGTDMFDAPFRVHIYENVNGLPGKDLVEQSLTYTAVKKKSWNTFDVSAHHIPVPNEGFWIAIEWIANEAYKKSVIYELTLLDGSKRKDTYTYYGPEIIAHFDTDFGLTYYKYLATKKWYKKTGRSSIGLSKRMRPAHIDLLVKSTLRVYE